MPPPPSAAPPTLGYLPVDPLRPVRVRYDPDQPPPAGYTLVTRPRRPFVVTGAFAFGLAYTISLAEFAARTPDDETDMLAIPLVGPLMTITRSEPCPVSEEDEFGQSDCEVERDLRIIWYGFDTTFQLMGAAFVALGFAVPSRWYFRDDVKVAFVPARFGEGAGFIARGHF